MKHELPKGFRANTNRATRFNQSFRSCSTVSALGSVIRFERSRASSLAACFSVFLAALMRSRSLRSCL
jgi:hypothetical protein